MAKILLINPMVREEDVPRHVPYGMALLASIAMREGHQVQVYDHNAWRKGADMLEQVCTADDWDVIATGGITTAYGSIKEIVSIAQRICPRAVVMLGGGVLTSLPRDMMTWLHPVDVGAVGEAFETFPEMLTAVDQAKAAVEAAVEATGDGSPNALFKHTIDWSAIAGTVSRDAQGELKFSAERKLIEDLDTLPYPAWELFPLEEVYFPNSQVLYSEEGMQASRRLDINGSYGCSMICRYCYHLGIAGDMRYTEDDEGKTQVEFDKPGTYTRSIRYHSPEYIVNLAKYAQERFDINFVAFLDENLMTMNRASGGTWLPEICRLWKEKGLQPDYLREGRERTEDWTGVLWSGTSHATLVDKDILADMREAGCSYLIYGYESFSPHVMKTVGKGASPTTNERSFFWTLESGIRPLPNQIIGFPVEDFDSIRQNMAAWDKLGIQSKPFIATPYPGSEWFTVYRDRLIEQYGGDLEAFILALGDATSATGVISENFNAVELLGLRELMVARDYRGIDAYEKVWRKHHNIAEGEPSTLVKKPKPKTRLKVAS